MKYIPGHTNIVADTLSRLEIEDNYNPEAQTEELFGLDKDELSYELPKNAFPLKISTIYKHQKHDANFSRLQKTPLMS